MKKRYWLGIAISLLLVYLLFRTVDLAKFGRALLGADFRFLVPAVVLYFVGVLVRTVRWAVLMKPVGRVGVGRLFVVMVIGFMANDILPLRAGEAVRAFLLWRKERLEPGATIATIVVERIFDGLALTGLLLLAGLMIPLDQWLTGLAWVAGLVFLVGIGVVLALTVMPGPLLGLARMVLTPMPARLRDLGLRLLGTFVEGLGILRSARDTLAVALLSLVAWGIEATVYYILMFSFAFPPRFVASALGTAVANLFSMVPSSPGYLGTFDLPLSAVMAGTFGVDQNVAAAYTSLVRAVLFIPVILLGLLLTWREGLTLRGLAAGRAEGERGSGQVQDSAGIAPRRSSP